MTLEEVNQEIEWLREEIADDEAVLSTSSGEQFHKDRLAENKQKLQEMLEWKDKIR